MLIPAKEHPLHGQSGRGQGRVEPVRHPALGIVGPRGVEDCRDQKGQGDFPIADAHDRLSFVVSPTGTWAGPGKPGPPLTSDVPVTEARKRGGGHRQLRYRRLIAFGRDDRAAAD